MPKLGHQFATAQAPHAGFDFELELRDAAEERQHDEADPEQDRIGVEVTAEAAGDAACTWKAPIHIIALTAIAMQGDREKCIEAGANAYVIKPDLKGLVSSIRQFASEAPSPTARIIPFKRKTGRSSPFTFEPAAA